VSKPEQTTTEANAEAVQRWQPPSVGTPSKSAFHHEAEIESEDEPDNDDDNPSIPTAEEIEQWHKQAFEEGYADGKKQAQQEVDELKRQLLEVINFFEQPLHSLNEEVEQQLSLLAVTLAQQLVRREIKIEPGEIIALIRESVKLLPANSRKIRIYLHPEDAEIVRNTLQLDAGDDDENWQLVEDPMITRGGCEIKSEQSTINATLENRLQALAASVLGGERIEDKEDAAATD
jgi:flagellar assembly protein FliH